MKERNYGLDLYRICCMFLITTIHILGYSNITEAVPYTNFNFYLIYLIKVLQSFSISGFVLISAYFLVSKKSSVQSSVKKVVSFELQTIFYSVLIMVLSILLISTSVSKSNLLKSFFPMLTNHYWYPVNYAFLLLVSPILNKFIYVLSERALKILVIGIFALFGFVNLNPFFTAGIYVGHDSHSFLWFVCLYFIAAYIKLYGINCKISVPLLSFIISGSILFTLYLFEGNIFGLRVKFEFIHSILQKVDLLSYNSLFPLIFTVSSFVLFSKINFKLPQAGAKVWSFTMPAVYVVYLLQEHNAVREKFWEVINIERWATSPCLILIMLAIFLVLLAVSVILYICFYFANKLFISKVSQKIELLIINALKKFKLTDDLNS